MGGHSLGVNTIQTLCNNTEAYCFAAVASTSFPNPEFTAPQMPCYLIVGQSDISEPLPDPKSQRSGKGSLGYLGRQRHL